MRRSIITIVNHFHLDLASSALGSAVIKVTDEFFAPASMMLNPEPALHCPDKFVGSY
jgi:allantoicase